MFSDEELLLRGLQCELQGIPELAIFPLSGEASTLVDSAIEIKPEVLLIDWVPGVDFSTLRTLKAAVPSAHLILWTRELPAELAYQAIEVGVRGILLHNAPSKQLRECLLQVASGELWLDRAMTMALLTARPINLTRRESQLVELLSRGLKNKEIATELGISEGTVKVYLSKLFEKVGAKDRFELALFGVRQLQRNGARQSWPANGAMSEGSPRTILLRR